MKLIVKNLVKKFKSTIAVNNISLEIEKNNTLGLLGPNGCGKTTSIGMMLGLITPTSGEIFIDGIKLNSENRINLLSLMNFASPYVELPKKLTVKQNLEVYARLYGVSNKVERIEELEREKRNDKVEFRKMLQEKEEEFKRNILRYQEMQAKDAEIIKILKARTGVAVENLIDL